MLSKIKKIIPEPLKRIYHFLQSLFGAVFFRFPAESVKVIGITGTDGKTTTSYLLHHILNFSQKKASMISTVEAKIGSESIETGLHVTTPDPIKVQALLRKIADEKSEYAVLETTSHGLAQERVAFVNFYAGLVTNVTHEHLDYHKTYESYLKSKAKLLKGVKFRILNADDISFPRLKDQGSGQLVTYGVRNKSDFQAKKINLYKEGLDFEAHFLNKQKGKESIKLESNLVGRYNVYNILAAFSAAFTAGCEPEQIAQALGSFDPPVGRMQSIKEGQDFDVVVDFAHTPAALEEALKALKEYKEGRLIAVFGSAGERDVHKRAMMGRVATRNAEISVFTAEDPRSEEVADISEEIAKGARAVGGVENKTFYKVSDRGQAVNFAIRQLAQKGDIVAIFGKGHEKSMNIKGVEYPWSDEKAARSALKELK